MSVKSLNEDKKLNKGIFWIKDLDDYNNSLYFQIPVNSDGMLNDVGRLNLNSKKSDNYNHEITWKYLNKSDTEGHDYNYYPRGRVEINHGRAIVFANPNICTDELLKWVISAFNLYEYNGINKISIKPDNSEHYMCYLDCNRR